LSVKLPIANDPAAIQIRREFETARFQLKPLERNYKAMGSNNAFDEFLGVKPPSAKKFYRCFFAMAMILSRKLFEPSMPEPHSHDNAKLLVSVLQRLARLVA
jgi:hypothetical protein